MRRFLLLVALLAFVPTVSASALSDYTPIRPDGTLASGPAAAAARGGAQRSVAVRGTDGGVWLTESDDPAQPFGPWRPLGAPFAGVTGDPALVSWEPGRLDLFVRGGDNRLWQRFRPAGGGWSDWIKPMGDDGVLASGPDVTSRGPGRLDVFVRGTDGQVYERFYEGAGWNRAWLPQGTPPGGVGVVGEPAAAGSDTMRVDLFVRGTDNELWTKWFDGSVWSAWFRPEETFHPVLTSSPEAVSGGRQQVVVFARGSDGNMWSTEGNGTGRLSWRGWLPESSGANPIQDRPAAAARGLSQIDVFVRGVDDRAHQFRYAPPLLPPPLQIGVAVAV